MRNEIISSQNNVHPGRKLKNNTWSDARVLSLRELLILTSLPPDIDLPTDISDTALRQFIGEGIPPKMMQKILEGISI
jgi:DNA (cytosine-5)-methyltransferase 1